MVQVPQIRFWLFIVLAFFLNLNLNGAVQPPNTPAMDGPPGLPAAQVAIFYQTVTDAMVLAKTTALFFPCDAGTDEVRKPSRNETIKVSLMCYQIFLRYFKPEDAEFVKNLFRAIANIPFDLDLYLSEKTALEAFLATRPPFTPKFQRLSIYFLGDNPSLALPNGPGVGTQCGTNPDGDVQATTNAINNGKYNLVSICGQAYTKLPMLNDIINPPDWAKDPSKDQTGEPQYYEGYGCSNLGIFDSDHMDSVGAVLLHELFHWPGLFEDVSGYASNEPLQGRVGGSGPGSGPVDNAIRDFPGSDPSSGYGPYNARIINEQEPEDNLKLAKWKGIMNVDNFVFYALSTYFSRVCKIDFKEAPDLFSAAPRRVPPPWPFSVPPPA